MITAGNFNFRQPTQEPTPDPVVQVAKSEADNIVGKLSAGQFINLAQQAIDAAAAASRPLIYNPLDYVPPPQPSAQPQPQASTSTEVVSKKKVSGQSRYMRDMLTVEKL